MNADQVQFHRQTYDFLHLLGDIGGLQSALFVLVKVIISFLPGFNASSLMMNKLFMRSNSAYQRKRTEQRMKVAQRSTD